MSQAGALAAVSSVSRPKPSVIVFLLSMKTEGETPAGAASVTFQRPVKIRVPALTRLANRSGRPRRGGT